MRYRRGSSGKQSVLKKTRSSKDINFSKTQSCNGLKMSLSKKGFTDPKSKDNIKHWWRHKGDLEFLERKSCSFKNECWKRSKRKSAKSQQLLGELSLIGKSRLRKKLKEKTAMFWNSKRYNKNWRKSSDKLICKLEESMMLGTKGRKNSFCSFKYWTKRSSR